MKVSYGLREDLAKGWKKEVMEEDEEDSGAHKVGAWETLSSFGGLVGALASDGIRRGMEAAERLVEYITVPILLQGSI